MNIGKSKKIFTGCKTIVLIRVHKQVYVVPLKIWSFQLIYAENSFLGDIVMWVRNDCHAIGMCFILYFFSPKQLMWRTVSTTLTKMTFILTDTHPHSKITKQKRVAVNGVHDVTVKLILQFLASSRSIAILSFVPVTWVRTMAVA